MPASPAEPIWDLDGPYGRERWIGEPGRFRQVLLDDQPVSLDAGDGAGQLLRFRDPTCSHPGPFPFAFRFCPACGAHLRPPPPVFETGSWSTPGTASGLPVAACHGVPDPASRAAMPLPGPAQLDWFVAGTPPRLLTFDQGSGRVFGWTEGPSATFADGRWRDLVQVAAGSGLPGWAWGIAAFPDGAALPCDTGPVFLQLGPRSCRPVVPDPALAVSRCLGGAAAVGTGALVPVLSGTGVGVAGIGPDSREWQVTPVDGVPTDEVFAAPSLGATEAIWVGQHGQLFARILDGGIQCGYRPWRDGWVPMPAVRPVLSPNGTFHQLGRLDGRQAFESLLPPGATPQRRMFDRYLTSIGGTSFMGAARFREPWEPKRTEFRGVENGFLLPLLEFDGDRALLAACTPRMSLRSFTETTPDAEEAVECRLMFAGSSIVLTDLGVTIRARSAWELSALVFGRTLLVYDARGNKGWTWSLSDAS